MKDFLLFGSFLGKRLYPNSIPEFIYPVFEMMMKSILSLLSAIAYRK